MAREWNDDLGRYLTPDEAYQYRQAKKYVAWAKDGCKLPVYSTKSGLIAFLLALFLGVFGIHYFYLGRWKRALVGIILSPFIPISIGCWGMDLVKLLFTGLEDSEGHIVSLF